MRRLAALGLSERLNRFSPSPARFKYCTSHGRAADFDEFKSSFRKVTNLVGLVETLQFRFGHNLCWLFAHLCRRSSVGGTKPDACERNSSSFSQRRLSSGQAFKR